MLLIIVPLFVHLYIVRFKGIPLPAIHDEFSYLLAADTYRHGRLSNPTHPYWQHFESMHIIHEPRYASKYQPAQGAMLALGRILFGEYYYGNLISIIIVSLSLYWMLRGWFSFRWSLLTVFMFNFNPVIVTWGQNYWGGAIPLIGGALMMGVAGRIINNYHTVNALHGIILGIGLFIFANSRPYEGGVIFIIVCLTIVFILVRNGCYQIVIQRLLGPFFIVIIITIIWLAYFNWSISGSVVRMPYVIHEQAYAIAPIFVWQKVKKQLQYRHEEIKKLHADWSVVVTRPPRNSLIDFAVIGFRKLLLVLKAFCQQIFILVFLAISVIQMYRIRIIMLMYIWGPVFMMFVLFEAGPIALHYVAPACGLLLIIVTKSLNSVSKCKFKDKNIGMGIVVIVIALSLFGDLHGIYRTAAVKVQGQWYQKRDVINNDFSADKNKHLIFVRYGSYHNIHEEWVYNAADIDDSAVVWARTMGPDADDRLCNYYSERKWWVLEVDKEYSGQALLHPYGY